MNRQQRRATGRAAEKIAQKRAKSPEMDTAYRAGYERGFRAAMRHTWEMCFAAVTTVLHDQEGYGPMRTERFLRQLDETMTTTLTSEEAIEAALEKAGVILDFDGAFPEDRVTGVRGNERGDHGLLCVSARQWLLQTQAQRQRW